MKNALLLAVLFGSLTLASAQTNRILYQEDWGATYGSIPGNTAATTLPQVGWTAVGGQYTGMYAAGAGSFDIITGASVSNRPCYFSSSIVSSTGIIYTTDTSGSGTNGDSSFADIDPTAYSSITLNVSAQVSAGAGTVTNFFAVQVGGQWYVSATPLTNSATLNGGITFGLNSQVYNPLAANWKTLTINASDATVGSLAGANLSGPITGIGIVQVWAATLPGTPGFNYVNLTITTPYVNPPGTAPIINGLGYSVTNYQGGGASFAVNATVGSAPLTYAWHFNDGSTLANGPTGNGSTIFGATTSQITISNIQPNDAGTYSVVVGNGFGSDNSSAYGAPSLTVIPVTPEILYAESFPFVGPLANAISTTNVGWRSSIPATNPNRLDSRGDIYVYDTAARNVGFFTSNSIDNGSSGLAFPAGGINPALYPFVSFRVNLAYVVGTVPAYFAVQMAGGQWYVSTSAIQPGPAPTTFTTYGLQFSPVASGWNRLTVNNTSVTVGTAATADLTGNIVGAGMVYIFAGGGLSEFNDFMLVTNSTPPISPSFPSEPNVPYLQTVYVGAGTSFSFTEAGTLPFTNTWHYDNSGGDLINDGVTASGSVISGANTTQITIQNISAADARVYSAVVLNPGGSSSTDSSLYGSPFITVVNQPIGFIYNETFPFYSVYAGNQPLTFVGWAQQSVEGNALFTQNATTGQAAAFAFASGTTNHLFYTGTETDTGYSGLPFIAFDPANYPGGTFTFAANLASGNGAYTNVSAAFAVRVGGVWYGYSIPVVSNWTSPSTPNTPLTGTYTRFEQSVNIASTQWNTITFQPGGGVAVGGHPATKLTGAVTGAGLLFQHYANAGGDINFNYFEITGTGIGGPNITVTTNGVPTVTWVGNPLVNLQTTTNLSPASWSDVAGTLGAHSRTITAQPGKTQYFRVVEH